MLRLSRIIRDYDEAGSVNSLLQPWGFVDDETFMTKAGHVGMVFRRTGVGLGLRHPTTLGTTTDAYDYNDFGEPKRQTARVNGIDR